MLEMELVVILLTLILPSTRGKGQFLKFCMFTMSATSVQDVATRLGLKQGSLKHYGIDSNVDSLILMADIVLYGSSQEEQGFPPLLTRAMSFGIPIIAPDYPVIRKYVCHFCFSFEVIFWLS